MHLGRPLTLGHRQSSNLARTTPCRQPLSQRQHTVIVRNSWFGGGESKEEAARKALQGLGGKPPPKQQPGKQPPPAKQQPAKPATDSKVPPTTPAFTSASPAAAGSSPSSSPAISNPLDSLKNVFSGLSGQGGGSGASGGRPGGGGGGGGGFSGFGAPAGGDDELETPFLQELREMLYAIWMVLGNTAMFLTFACWLHRTLAWAIEVELLFLVGAPQQAFEKVASLFFDYLEAFERNVLGWDLPVEEQFMPAYEEIAHYYPRETAFTFDGYRYPMTAEEKATLVNAYALHYTERIGGFPGDTDPAEVQRIKDKYEPMEADRREWQEAKALGRESEYWATHQHIWEQVVGSPITLRPAATAAENAAAAAGAAASTRA